MASADLVGAEFGPEGAGWVVTHKAPAQARVRFWTLAHQPCGAAVDLPQSLLQQAIKGKSTLPPCVTCFPETHPDKPLPAISHGLHISCGSSHLIGTECPDGVRREPNASNGPGNRLDVVERLSDPYEPKVLIQGVRAAPAGAPASVSVWDQFEVTPEPADLAVESFKQYGALPPLYPTPFVPEVHQPTTPEEHALVAERDAEYAAMFPSKPAWALTDSEAPPATKNEAYRDVLLAPMRAAMAGHERNAQVKPGPSAIGGCERKLAYQILFPEKHVAHASGWAAIKGTVMHAWYDVLVADIDERLPDGSRRWLTDLELPPTIEAVTGGHLDVIDLLERKVVDEKYPGTSTMKLATAGRLSNGYYVQTQVYGLGAELLGHEVKMVGLLFSPMCGDDLDAAVYWEWPYDREIAKAALANAERIEALGKVVPDKVALLDVMATKSDFCGSCPVMGRHCAGESAYRKPKAADPVWPAFDAAVAAMTA